MSLKAKGLLSMMLSLPDEWDYSIAGLVAISKENETAIKSALKELQDFGYLEIKKSYPNETETGRISYEYIVREKPIQEVEKQEVENLPLENLGAEKQGQLNTNESNTNKLNTKDIIDYLNMKTGRHYQDIETNRRHIRARINEGRYTLDDFKRVIDNKVADWGNDNKMSDYLRPSTLFGTKFESYLNQKPKNKNPFKERLRA